MGGNVPSGVALRPGGMVQAALPRSQWAAPLMPPPAQSRHDRIMGTLARQQGCTGPRAAQPRHQKRHQRTRISRCIASMVVLHGREPEPAEARSRSRVPAADSSTRLAPLHKSGRGTVAATAAASRMCSGVQRQEFRITNAFSAVYTSSCAGVAAAASQMQVMLQHDTASVFQGFAAQRDTITLSLDGE